MKIDGGCHCGHVTYEAEISTDVVRICHCTDCQKMSGSAYRAVVPTKEVDVTFLNNPPKDYIKTSESGNPRVQAFCPECGTHLYATSVENVGNRMLNIRLGSINQKDQLTPTDQVWCRSAQSWAFNIADIPRYETQPG